MKSIFDGTSGDTLKRRIEALTPAAVRQWGKMTLPQALAHVSVSLEAAAGDVQMPREFIGYLFGRLAKRIVFRDDKPFGRNAPTAKALVIADQRDLAAERERLLRVFTRIVSAGPAGCTSYPHPFFGKLTGDEWGVLIYKHVDHHLRQFGA